MNKNSFVESPKLEMNVLIRDLSKSISNKPIVFYNTNHIPQITEIDLFNLPKDKLIAFNEDKKSIFNYYKNASEAARILDNKNTSKYINRYINKEKLVLAGNKKLYFVMHPDYLIDLAKRMIQ